MKLNKSVVGSFVLLVLMASLYRIMPGRPLGFAPQIAMALFAGSVIKDKKVAFLLPLFSMLISDVLYELLYTANVTSIKGFYEGQIANYVLFMLVTVVGFAINQRKPVQIFFGSVAGVLFYYLISNFGVWIGGGLDINNLPYPKTVEGLVYCYTAAIPFLKGSFYATLFFGAILFGGYYIIETVWNKKAVAA